MNVSGQSVACLVKRWQLDLANLLVVLDDISLPLGMVRIRGEGSAGGHLGLDSVLNALGSRSVPRLRVGIGWESRPLKDLTPFVLGKFTESEKQILEGALAVAMEACRTWIVEGMSRAMNRFNRRISCKNI
jgi:PTH1 family peptidyl-tRNA hydrolase